MMRSLDPRILVALAFFSAAPALAQTVGEVVWAEPPLDGQLGTAGWRPLAVKSSIDLDMVVKTGRLAAGLMTFDTDGALALRAETEVKLDQALLDGIDRPDLRVARGLLRLTLPPATGRRLKISTPHVWVLVTGTQVEVGFDALSEISLVRLLEGRVEVHLPSGEVLILEAGEEVRIDRDGETVRGPLSDLEARRADAGRPRPPNGPGAGLDPTVPPLGPKIPECFLSANYVLICR